MKAPWHYMTKGDWLVVLLLLLVSLIGIAWLASAPGGTRVVVTSGNRTLFASPLDQPRRVNLDGPLGPTLVVIENDEVRIDASPCPRKTCLSMGPAKQTGDLLACVPNRILVHIEGPVNTEAAYDLLSR